MIKNSQAVVLAAGKSTRFNTGRTKLAEKLCGQEVILYVTKLFEQLFVPTTVVVGYQEELLRNIIQTQHGDTIEFVTQPQQLGSWHAFACSRENWKEEHIIIMNGDMPLVTAEIVEKLYEAHTKENADISFVIAHYHEPSESYGRIVKSDGVITIVEAKEFAGDPQEDCCINAGIYLVKREFLESQLESIQPNKITKEFYLTDLIKNGSVLGKKVIMVNAPFDRVRGVNTLEELWASEQIKRSELIRHWMSNGVRFSGAQNSHIDLTVKIGSGTIIEGGVKLRGNTVVGQHAYIGEFSSIENSHIEDYATIHPHCVIKQSHVGSRAEVGPFAHLREQSEIGKEAIVGNFVEIKKTKIGAGSKAKHHAYLGDALIGDSVIIGAGVITANHNGVHKEQTVIHNGAYIGSNSVLVAPVLVGEQALIAAGSTITHDIPENALAIARSRQINKEQYAKKRRTARTTKKSVRVVEGVPVL